MSNHDDLLILKEEIEEAKNQSAELKGKKKTLVATLKNKFGCASIKEAKTKAKALGKEISKLEKELEDGIVDLKQKHEML